MDCAAAAASAAHPSLTPVLQIQIERCEFVNELERLALDKRLERLKTNTERF
jgi:hypothetical protein